MKELSTSSQKSIEARIRNIHNKFHDSESVRDKTILEQVGKAHQELEEAFSSFGVLSLSATPSSILMWSHYGAQHSGLCLEFARESDSLLGKEAKQMEYVSRRLASEPSNVMFEKYLGWKYEREWRVVQNKGDMLYPHPGRLVSVICGSKMAMTDRVVVETLVRLLNERNSQRITVKYAKMHPESYRLTITKKPILVSI